MKRLLTFVLVAFAMLMVAPCSAQRAAAPERIGLSDTQYDYPLYGNVASITVTAHELVNRGGKESKGEFYYSNVIKFTPQGHVSSASIYFGEGVSELCTYLYNQQGRLTQINHVDEYDGSAAGKTTFQYGSNGKLNQQIRYAVNGSQDCKFTFAYDSSGRLSTKCDYASNGKLTLKSVNSYGSNGKLSQTLVYDGRGALIYKKKFTYDSYKNLIRFTTYAANGAKEYEETYTYNANGYMTSSTEYDAIYGVKTIYKYKYDSRGNVIEWRSYDGNDNSPESILTFQIAYK